MAEVALNVVATSSRQDVHANSLGRDIRVAVFFFWLGQSNDRSWWPLPAPIPDDTAGYSPAPVLSSPSQLSLLRFHFIRARARLSLCPSAVGISRYASADRIGKLATIQATPSDWLYQALQYV